MSGGKLEGNSPLPCLPGHESVGEAPLGGNFGGPFVLPCFEQAGEQHRAVPDIDFLLQLDQLFALQIRKRRYEVEVPVSAGHEMSAVVSRPGERGGA